MRLPLRALVWVLLPLLGGATLLAQDTVSKGGQHGWPFGVSRGEGPMASLDKRDLYNLGVLGAKAWDANRPEPEPRRTGGQRRFRAAPRPEKDVGPERLLIRALYPDGPAMRAGLKLGDVLVGLGRRRFKGGCFAPLSKALLRAESRKGKQKIDLMVERGKELLTLTAEIPFVDKSYSKPEQGKARERILKDALKWLAQQQAENGGFRPTLGGNNGAVVMTSLAGLAWLSGGSSLDRGPQAKNLQAALDFVTSALGAKSPLDGRRPGGANWDQSTWAYAHAGIFLGELQHVSPREETKQELGRIAKELAARQEVSGGYAHGPGGPNALGYLELNIMAGFVLSSIGLAKQAGCEVEMDCVDKLLKYCEKSSAGGGVGYSTKNGQQGRGNIGRSAGAWLGAVACGKGRNRFVRAMGSYVKSHVADALGGHATLMQHILLAGLAAKASGKSSSKRFWKAMLPSFILARAPDGSLHPRPWHESLNMQSNTDVSLGPIWTTACWAIVLGAGEGIEDAGGLPAWCRSH
ncbi:MAG: hypothetical protein CSA62_08645 [Planctomycetota bacterium]|nr:MAG: hypothetical protein CSA62_08645 [Planctomycetota bacterium]